jgi:hypothetical protein
MVQPPPAPAPVNGSGGGGNGTSNTTVPLTMSQPLLAAVLTITGNVSSVTVLELPEYAGSTTTNRSMYVVQQACPLDVGLKPWSAVA